MDREEIIKKAETGEGLTVEEIKIYQEAVRPKKQVYGKYGTLAKEYLENHNIGKLWSLADDLPEYLSLIHILAIGITALVLGLKLNKATKNKNQNEKQDNKKE